MDKDQNYYYKTCDFIFKNLKEELQRNENEYGYNFDSTKRRIIQEDFSRTVNKINREFQDNHKLR